MKTLHGLAWRCAGLLLLNLAGCGEPGAPPLDPSYRGPWNFDELTPAAAQTPLRFSAMAVASGHVCMLTSAGQAWCWGDNRYGQLGNLSMTCGGPYSSPCSWQPLPVMGDQAFVQLVAAPTLSCGLTAAGQAWCWGDGYLGDGAPYQTQPRPVPAAGGHVFTQLTTGLGGLVCGLKADGGAWCWGATMDSAGSADPLLSAQPQRWQAAGTVAFKSLSIGNQHACGLDASGRAWCLGQNSNGQLGDGTHTNAAVPVPVAGGHVFRQISAGGTCTCALTLDNRAWCWPGICAGAGTGDAAVPVVAGGGRAFAGIDTAQGNTCAIASDGAGWCWGNGHHGTLGGGVDSGSFQPVAVIGGFRFVELRSSLDVSCGITTDAQAVCWGYNGVGAVGRPVVGHDR